MRDNSNPVMRGVVRDNQPAGYAGFGAGLQGMQQGAMMAGQQQLDPQQYAPTTTDRPITVDDVVTKTAMTLGVLLVAAIASFFAIASRSDADAQFGLAMPILLVGSIGGLITVLIATFGRKQDNPAVVLTYAVFEGLFVGAISFVLPNAYISGDVPIAGIIGQAVLGTVGVFVGMLVVYKVGAIRVTPRFTRMLTAGMVGVLVLMLGNLVLSLFGVHTGLREAGWIGIVFSLVCIGLAAMSFLVDFDSADQLVKAGAPSRAAWGVALGLTVTLVWLYTEILRLVSILNND
ncbi:MAG: Bax inhibitor-1/YccA family protein [Gordonia sp. (in: high G+C Gram-positive bacteria)]|uniref:Bax inhibitor-1/YccA family protein n=1 Tax=Gordonia sp. (in: high G+C Gram-positive bacteria) TaxID=84139 RepID=UPI0039E690ED